jgi:hypothetical protein
MCVFFCVPKIGNDQSPAWSWLETKLTNQESPSCSEVITEGDAGNPFGRKDVPRDARDWAGGEATGSWYKVVPQFVSKLDS